MASELDNPPVRLRHRRVPPEALPGIGPMLFREIDRRIAPPLLQSDRLPDDFLVSEDPEGRGKLLFGGRRYDLNITVFKRRQGPRGRCAGSGLFVISNGAGAATNTVDLLAGRGPVAGMIDLKRNFTAAKILAALRMALTARPDVDAMVLNIISGIAFAADAIAAVAQFDLDVDGRVPVLLRFNGPGGEDNRPLLRALAEERENVFLVDSTAQLVKRAAELFALEPPVSPSPDEVLSWIEESVATRADLGVTSNPSQWLVPERTLDCVFRHKAEARLGVLGYGSTARFQTEAMIAAGVEVVWAVTPSADKHTAASRGMGTTAVPVYPTAADAIAAEGDVDIVVNYAPAAHVAGAAQGLIDAQSGAGLMMIVAENMAYDWAIDVMDALDSAGIAFLGPNCPGVMIVEDDAGTPDRFKIGNMPAHLFEAAGGLSLVGRSGTVLFDMVDQASDAGIGIRMAWAIGGDRYTGLGFLDALVILEQDPKTRIIVLDGEGGGIQEQLAARLVATGVISKPVLAIVTGRTLPAGIQYGHASSTKITEADDPLVKERHLRDAGCIIVQDPTQMVQVVQQIERSGWDLEEQRRDALWYRTQQEGRWRGSHWLDAESTAFELLHRLVGTWRLSHAIETYPEFVHELIVNLSVLGVENIDFLLRTESSRAAFVTAFEKSPEYVAELMRGASEVGGERFHAFVTDVVTEDVFSAAFRTTPWAAADILNEAHQVGLGETVEVISRTVGLVVFRETFARKPWNSAHALRSINNMSRWRFVRAYHRICAHLVGDSQPIKAAWRRNPWAAVKLVRGYDRIPDSGLENALGDPKIRDQFMELAQTDPLGLLEIGKHAFKQSVRTEAPFKDVYRALIERGVPARPTVEGEIEAMGPADFGTLIDLVFTADAFERSLRDHPNSTARGLKLINSDGDEAESGVSKIARTFLANTELFDSDSFRVAVGRNLWMSVDILRAVGRLEPVQVRRIVDYVVTQAFFDFALAEHQWGTSQALHKIADMGARRFFTVHQLMEDATRDHDSFRIAFKKNPRDTVQIVQAVGQMGPEAFHAITANPETRAALLLRIRKNPRTAAHLIEQIHNVGAIAFDQLVDSDLGRDVLNEMLESRGPDLVRTVRRIAIVGADDFRDELRLWADENAERRITSDTALEVAGEIKERVLHRRFSTPERRFPISLPGQLQFDISEGEIRGLYESYPDWADVLFKLQANESMPIAEQIDLYHLVSGRKRFQTHMIPVLAHFMPLDEMQARVSRGERLIPEISRLKGVAQAEGHRFDAYSHTLEVLNQLNGAVLPLDFLAEPARERVNRLLDTPIDGVSRRELLVLSAALHDVGKADGLTGHVSRGLDIVRGVANHVGLTAGQLRLVEDVVGYHKPKKLRRPGERWPEFLERGGLELLFDELTAHGENAHPIETVLHYHADILGRQGEHTPADEVERRRVVSATLIERYLREHPGVGRS